MGMESSGGHPYWKWESLPKGRKAIPECRETIPTGWEAIPEGQEWLGGPSRGQGVARRSSRRARCGRESLPECREVSQRGWEWSGGPPGGLELGLKFMLGLDLGLEFELVYGLGFCFWLG